jgi:hypothetical protein
VLFKRIRQPSHFTVNTAHLFNVQFLFLVTAFTAADDLVTQSLQHGATP